MMNKRYFVYSVMAVSFLGCSPEQSFDLGYDCVNETKCIDDNTLATCVNGIYDEIKCKNKCDLTANRCFENECNDEYVSICKGNYRSYCENSKLKEELCSDFCNKGACVECIDNSDCETIDNASAVCSEAGTCEIVCDRNYVKSEKGICEPFVCKADDVSGCFMPEHGTAKCAESACGDGDRDCVPSSVCDFICDKDYVKTADGTDCEPVACTENDLSRCVSPEHGSARCEIKTCSNGDTECEPLNQCDFDCEDGYVKTADNRGCEPFVCNEQNLSNCTAPENAVSICKQNRCSFECDSKTFKSGNSCIECTADDISHCPSVVNGIVSCVDNQCKYDCLVGCYSWDAASNSCVIIDNNHDNVPDCYNSVNCDDKNIICLNTADDFIHLPDYFDAEGRVKPEYEGKYSGKSQFDVTFYLMNDINLKDAVTTIVDPVEKGCSAASWKAPALKGLKLKTPRDETKRIYYQYDINGETTNCSLGASLWKSLDDADISHLMIELDVNSVLDGIKAVVPFSAFVEKVTDSVLSDVSWKGTITISREKSKQIENLGGIVGEAVDTKMRRVYCVNSTIEAPEAKNAGCVIGLMKGGDFSNEADASGNTVVNKVALLDSNIYAGGLIGKLEKSPSKKGKVSVRNVKNDVVEIKSYKYVGGLIGDVSYAEIHDIDNSFHLIQCSKECGGLIGNVSNVSKIHDVVNKISKGVVGNNYDQSITIGNLGGLIGAVHAIDYDKKPSDSSDIKTEIYHIEQTVDNDEVAIQGETNIGGLIGGINVLYNDNFEVAIHDVDSQMPVVKGDRDETGNWVVGGLIGVGYGGQNHHLSIANIKNRVKTVESRSMTGGFIGDSQWTDFKNIDHQFESVTGYGQCGGFVAQANSCEFNDILNINAQFDTKEDGESTETDETGGEQPGNNENPETFLGVRNINTSKDLNQNMSHIGAGGFANYIYNVSSFDNILNDVHNLEMSGNHVYSIGGFINMMSGYITDNNEPVIKISHVTNRVKKLDGGCDKKVSEKNKINCLNISGFSAKTQYCKIENVINEVGEMTGYSISGFSDELQNAEISLVDSRIKKMTLLDDMAGFSFHFYPESKVGLIRSIVENVDAVSQCKQGYENCFGTGFAIFRREENSKTTVEISDIFSAYYINGVAHNANLNDGFLFIKYSDKDEEKTNILLNGAVSAERCVTYSDMEYHSNDEKLKIKDAQVACVNFTPKNGSSIYYYAPDDTYTPFPDASSEYQCGDMCIGYTSQKSVDEIVTELNKTQDEEHFWKKESLTIGPSTAEMPVLELKNAGCISPICKDDEGTGDGDGGNDGGNDGGGNGDGDDEIIS